MRVRRLVGLAVIAAMAIVVPAHSSDDGAARRTQALIVGLDYEQARAELATAEDDPSLAHERARLALYEMDCDGAAAILGRPELQKSELVDIAKGCQRVTAALAVDRDEEQGVEVHWQDEHDRALAPLIFETVTKAREVLSKDLGVDWPRPTRIVVVRDLLSLSAMTGLPYKSAQTTGTVAVAKWGRVTLLSPRATRDGYPWRDTLAHELTHLAVTRASRDHAPLWLQEGVAKREEVRWRSGGPFDDRPPPEAIVLRGQEQKVNFPLDKLGPSIAMLPSADAAMVAFAEVTSFVRFYVKNEGQDALPRLLAELKAGKEPDDALLAASGSDLRGWDAKWRAYLALRTREPMPTFWLDSESRRHSASVLRDTRDRYRLGELLLARGHAAEALDELGTIGAATVAQPSDPSTCALRARALEAAGRRGESEPLVADPAEVESSYGPWWALRGRTERARGDEGAAKASFLEALAADPFAPEAACESTDASEPDDPALAPLCDAARAWSLTPLDE
jgi:peptidase MA superfamily protein